MSQHEHQHGKDHHHGQPAKKKLHHDWRFWAAILMLIGMGIYVMTMDESLEPGGQVQPEVPAAAE